MAKPTVIIVGADKGGVGKTMISRCLLDYSQEQGHRASRIRHRDAGRRAQALLSESRDRRSRRLRWPDEGFRQPRHGVTVIDIRARLLTDTIKLLSEIGFLDSSKCSIVVLHVLGNSQASIDEVKAVTDSIAGARYVRSAIASTPPNSISRRKRSTSRRSIRAVCEGVDQRRRQSFFDFINGRPRWCCAARCAIGSMRSVRAVR
jgi:hypothetical protein